MSREKIIKKGIERGIVKGDGSEMTDREVFNLTFAPGFSTAEKITDVSGRGVGMDVVRRNIEKIKGKVDISSHEGKGSQFIVRIPLTLAIIEGMLVRVGTATYTIPLLAIKESIKVKNSQINTVDDEEVVRLRGKFLPVCPPAP